VPAWAHFMAAILVATGTLFSTFWILSVNSWMQTPAGASLVDGRFMPGDWWAIVFNPSFPTRLGHTVIGFYITTGFVVLSVAAFYLRHNRFVTESRLMLSVTLWLLLALVPLQIFLGDASGLVTLAHQPTKLAAIEARWETGSGVPLTLFAIPDQENATNHYAVEIPRLGSLILTHEWNGTVKGLKEVPREDWPPVIIPFFAFRIMVGVGLLMLAIVVAGNLLRRHDQHFTHPLFLRVCQYGAPLGFIAVLAGWTTTEVGRQPWTVYGLLRTADSVSPSLTGTDVAISLAFYVLAYCIIFPSGWFVLSRIVRRGPAEEPEPEQVESGRPRSPVRRSPAEEPAP
jgi:cytochrome bd ubiquinol oxidase subunit I